MTPERREELRRAEDAVKHARYTLDRKNYIATIEAQEDRIKALESLLARAGDTIVNLHRQSGWNYPLIDELEKEIHAILPVTEVESFI